MGLYGDYCRTHTCVELTETGAYYLFYSRGSGVSPQGICLNYTENTILFDELPRQSHRWNHRPDPRLSEFMNFIKSQYGKDLGVFFAIGEAFKPYERWAWEVRNVQYGFKANSAYDLMLFKLSKPSLDNDISHFLRNN